LVVELQEPIVDGLHMSDTSQDLLSRASEAKKQGRLAEARHDASQATGMLRRRAPGVELAQALRLLAEVERKLHQDLAARQHYEEEAELCRSYADPLMRAHTVRHLGDLYQELGHPELAEPCYGEALDLYRVQKDTPPLDLANAIRSMAVLKTDSGNTEQARMLWQEARDLYALVNVREGVAESSAQLSRLAG